MTVRIRKTDIYEKWFRRLGDSKAKARINARLRRIGLEGKLVGDCKPVGGKVTELRFDIGPGYRVYVTERNGELLILLLGGDKSSQQADIRKAQLLAREWEVEG